MQVTYATTRYIKTFCVFLASNISHTVYTHFSFSVNMKPNFPAYETVPTILSNVKMFLKLLLMYVLVLITFGTNHSLIMLPIA